jgi:hypothetical protein
METRVLEKKNVANVLIDIDQCLYHAIGQLPDAKSIEEWLIETNELLLNKILEKLSSKLYEKVIIGYITNRQSYITDKDNGGLTCTVALPILQEYFQTKLGCEVVLDPFWTADIFANKNNGGDKQAGDSYKLALKEYFGDKKLETSESNHSLEMFNHNKLFLLYAYTHRLSHFHKYANRDVIIIDDRKDFLVGMHRFAKHFPQAFPTCEMNFIQWKGLDIEFESQIQGEGITDSLYDWGVRYMWALTKEKTIEQPNQLQQAHEENHYFNYAIAMYFSLGMEPGDKMNAAEALILFRDHKDYKELKTTLGSESNYTTAEQLRKSGLIPLKFPHKQELQPIEFSEADELFVELSMDLAINKQEEKPRNKNCFFRLISSSSTSSITTASEKTLPQASSCLIL